MGIREIDGLGSNFSKGEGRAHHRGVEKRHYKLYLKQTIKFPVQAQNFIQNIC